jgi:hypothetical protein
MAVVVPTKNGRAAATARRGGYAFTGMYTANKKADVRIHDDLNKSVSAGFDAAVKLLLKVQDNAFAMPASLADAEIPQALSNAINRVLARAQAPRPALEQTQRDAQAAIAADRLRGKLLRRR